MRTTFEFTLRQAQELRDELVKAIDTVSRLAPEAEIEVEGAVGECFHTLRVRVVREPTSTVVVGK